jgi:hypothetical protein
MSRATEATAAELDRLADLLEARSWTFAKTMAYAPHWYTLRKHWADDTTFQDVCAALHRLGAVERYKGRPYICLRLRGYKYWTMAPRFQEKDPDRVRRRTILINRAEVPAAA